MASGYLLHRQRVSRCIEKGYQTDCTFVVGPKGAPKEELHNIHAMKAFMIIASPFMANVFDDKWTKGNSIRITNCSAQTFKLVVLFSHGCQLPDNLDSMALADLLLAADRFMMKDLIASCGELIHARISVDSVWPVLNKLMPIMDRDAARLSASFSEFLSKHTDRCLRHDSFVSATEGSVIFLLKLESMQLEREFQLVYYCGLWAMRQPSGNLAVRKLLPFLRLLTLTTDEVVRLPDGIFKGEEMGFVLKFSITKTLPRSNHPSQICCNTKPRKFIQQQFQIGWGGY